MLKVVLLGVALAMDSLAMSIANGIKYKNYYLKEMIMASLSFGIFQGMMPLLGYTLFTPFISIVEKYDHWIACGILCYLGFNMIKESLEKDEDDGEEEQFSFKVLMMQSIATSIDALSVGISLPTFEVNPYLICLVVAVITAFICLIGHRLGKKIALLLKNKALALGGIMLILIGVSSVLEAFGIL